MRNIKKTSARRQHITQNAHQHPVALGRGVNAVLVIRDQQQPVTWPVK